MIIINNEEMAMSQSGINWSALTSETCLNCFSGIATYNAACIALGIESLPTGGITALIAALISPLMESLPGVGQMRTYCPPCLQQLCGE